MNATSSRYRTLDAMRGIAALLVVVGHIKQSYSASSYLAVDFFYILSGFIIAQIYSARIAAGMGALAFMKARILRLYPLFAVGGGIGLLQLSYRIYIGDIIVAPIDLLLSSLTYFFMLPSPVYFLSETRESQMLALYPINGPAWSIFFELMINVVFALGWCRLSTSRLVGLTLLAAALLSCIVIDHGSMNIGFEWGSFVGGFARVTVTFTLGVLIQRLRSGRSRRSSPLAYIPILMLGMCLLLAPSVWMRPYADLVFAFVIAPLIVLAGTFVEPPAIAARLSDGAGYLSYPVYILHRGCVNLFEKLAHRFLLSDAVTVLLFCVFILPFAWLVALLVDRITKRMAGENACRHSPQESRAPLAHDG